MANKPTDGMKDVMVILKKKTDVGILKGWTQHRSRGEPLAHLANKGLEKKEGDRTSVKIGQVTKLK